MYHVKHAYGLPSGRLASWQEVASPESLTGLELRQYKELWFVLTHDDLSHEMGLDFDVIKSSVGLDQTLGDFLIENGEKALPTQIQIPYIKYGSLIYEDVYRARFKVGIANEHTSQTHDRYDDNHWVTLERQDLNTKDAYEYFLVSVNGFLHPTDYDTNRFYIQHAVESSLISGRAEIGIYSFEQIGKLQFLPITESLIVTNDEVSLKDRTIFKTQVDLTKFMPAISLGGYLHVADPRVLRSVGEGLLELDWTGVPLVKRYYESKDYINLSSLVLDSHTDNPLMINIEQLYSDEVLLAYLTLPQSFLIFIENDRISKEMLSVERGPTWDRYYGYTRHRYPMVSNTGKLVEYWKIEEEGVQSYFTPRASQLNHLYRRSDPRELVNIDPTLIGAFPSKPEDRGHSAFMRLFTTELRFK